MNRMKVTYFVFGAVLAALALQAFNVNKAGDIMDLGNFSVSLAVKDIKVSRAFYEKLGFEAIAGDMEQNWIILNNGGANIGLFQGMFEENLMTFNPLDVRSIQKKLKEEGIEIIREADESTTGPEHTVINDPDGNTILFDQHQ